MRRKERGVDFTKLEAAVTAVMVGARVGPFDVVSKLGEGGMGEVYRARDTRLGRDVAIKMLPPAFTADPDRVSRFEREARALASLNHPNIAIIHGVEETDGRGGAIILELVEGETLAERIGRGPVPVAEALGLARQLAEALGSAHERGIVHRDLKPANIKVTADGRLKVLDFGLAKLVADESPAPDLAQSPTVTAGATAAGVLLGTVAYMSPEQARGLAVDKRTDVWAFGCILFEMLTGQPAFAGSTTSDVIVHVLEREPPWELLPGSSPPPIRRLLRRCLQKDSSRRLRDIADARFEVDDALDPSSAADQHDAPAARPASSTPRVALSLAIAILGMAVGFAFARYAATAGAPLPDAAVRFSVPLNPGAQVPIDTGLPVALAVAPAGQGIVYAARDATGVRLYLRRPGELEPVVVAGGEGGLGPFFSPDGGWLAFASDGMLRAVPLMGGGTRTIAEAPNLAGGTWSQDGTIVFSGWNGPLVKVSSQGGRPQPLTSLDESDGEAEHTAPHALPGGRAVLFTVRNGRGQFIHAVDMRTGKRQALLEGRNPMYAGNGRLMFARADALFVVPFDPDTLEIGDVPVRVLSGVSTDGNDTHYSVDHLNTLSYIPERPRTSQLIWVDRQGRERPLDAERREYSHPRLSPDGRRAVVTLPAAGGGFEMLVYDVERGTRSRLNTPAPISRPIWTADGKAVTFLMRGDLYTMAADDSAPAQRVLGRDARLPFVFPLAWSRDGGTLMFSVATPATNRDLWTFRDGTPRPFLATARDERAAMFSPDARWVIYAALEPGREEQVYVQPYPGPGGRTQISIEGGIEPVWSPTGREIFYRSVDGLRMFSAEVRSDAAFSVGSPRELFAKRLHVSGGSYWSNYDVAPDGQRFLMLGAADARTPSVAVVVNWDIGNR